MVITPTCNRRKKGTTIRFKDRSRDFSDNAFPLASCDAPPTPLESVLDMKGYCIWPIGPENFLKMKCGLNMKISMRANWISSGLFGSTHRHFSPFSDIERPKTKLIHRENNHQMKIIISCSPGYPFHRRMSPGLFRWKVLTVWQTHYRDRPQRAAVRWSVAVLGQTLRAGNARYPKTELEVITAGSSPKVFDACTHSCTYVCSRLWGAGRC